MSEKQEENYDFNIMPLLDAIFLLTIFFIITVTFREEFDVLPVELPRAEKPELTKMEDAVTLEALGGDIFVNGKKYSLNDLEEALKEEFAATGSEALLIRADSNVPVSRLMRITGIARKAGIEKAAFAVRRLN